MKTLNRTKMRWGIVAFISASVLTGGILYYNYLTTYDKGILPPLGKKIPFVRRSFNAEDGLTLHMPTGTHIVIPKNALVDVNGNTVKGKVTARFREFHTAGEILHSGIPMQFGKDRTDYFSSGGMMELRVSQNGKELKIAPRENVNVELAAAIMPNADFKLYFLTDDMNWDNGKPFETVQNVRRDSALAQLPTLEIKPVDPVPGAEDIVFEISGGLKSTLSRAFLGTKWRLKELLNGEDIEFAFSVNWSSIKIEKPEVSDEPFKLHLTFQGVDYKGKILSEKCTALAFPLLTGDALTAAIAKYDKDYAAYEKELADMEKEKTRLLQEQGLLNRFQMEEFGICNIDRLMSTGLLTTLDITFDFEDELVPEIHRVMLYMVLEEQNGVLKFNAFEWNKLPVSNTQFSLVAVLPNGKVAYVPSSKIIEKLGQGSKQKLYLETEKYDYESFDKCMKNKTQPKFI
jgi:hypothetical protein